MSLLASHHRHGMPFEPFELVEGGSRVAVGLEAGWYQVFTFSADGRHVVHLQDCIDREDAFRQLSSD